MLIYDSPVAGYQFFGALQPKIDLFPVAAHMLQANFSETLLVVVVTSP
jgi:hypothetical protein